MWPQILGFSFCFLNLSLMHPTSNHLSGLERKKKITFFSPTQIHLSDQPFSNPFFFHSADSVNSPSILQKNLPQIGNFNGEKSLPVKPHHYILIFLSIVLANLVILSRRGSIIVMDEEDKTLQFPSISKPRINNYDNPTTKKCLNYTQTTNHNLYSKVIADWKAKNRAK